MLAQYTTPSATATTATEKSSADDTQDSSSPEDEMITPTPVSGAGLPLGFVEDSTRNYIHGGLTVQTGYDTRIFTLTSNVPMVNYSLLPVIDIGIARTRTEMDLSYSPGFTMYQGYRSLDHVDQNLAFRLRYRLTPHVALSVDESFLKTGYLQSLSYQNTTESGVGLIERPNVSIVPPVADLMSNFSNVEITYQFGPNSMVGAKGSLSQLWYSNGRSLRPAAGASLGSGVFDSGAQAGEVFYARRLSTKYYIGATYSFQKLLAHPNSLDTRTQSLLIFYSLYLRPTVSLSVFAGPQRSATFGAALPITFPVRIWSPEGGVSVSYQTAHMSFAGSFARRVAEGGGFFSAVRSSSATALVGFRMPGKLTFGLMDEYATNSTLNIPLPAGDSGHILSNSVSLERPLGKHLDLQCGYAHLHQTYHSILTSNVPDQQRAWTSVSYSFERALGR